MAKLKIHNRFGQTPNHLLNSKEASLKAKGLYGYIQSKPEDWNFSARRISKEIKEGLSSINKTLKELEDLNYLERVKFQNDKGHWEVEYVLHLFPYENKIPCVTNPTTENPVIGKPTNKESNSIQRSNKDVLSDLDKRLLHHVFIDEVPEKHVEYYKIAKTLLDFFIEHKKYRGLPVNNYLTEAKYANYVNPIRLLVESDGYRLKDVKETARYHMSGQVDNHFWKDQIFSTDKFRKQFDKIQILRMKYLKKLELKKQQEKKGMI